MRRTTGLAIAVAGLLAVTSGCALQSGTNPTGTGALMVSGESSARVLVDGTEKGATNEVIDRLTAGKHTVTVADAGSQKWTRDILISQGDTVSVSADGTLDLAPVMDESAELSDNSVLDAEPPTGEEVDPATVPTTRSIALSLVTADFAERDKLPQTTVPKSKWSSYGTYGPPAATYPAPRIPAGVSAIEWKQQRIASVAQKYLGLHYVHKHIPALGLDCSNFTSWVYNYGLGIKFTSSVSAQGASAGTKLAKSAPLAVGDLLYFSISGRIGHTGIYLGNNMMIDESTMNHSSVAVKKFNTGWPKSHFAFARRVIY